MGGLPTGVSWDAHLNDGADCLGFAKQMHELVMQLCSQLTNNPSAESAGRGWEFLEKVHLDFAIE